MQYVAELDKEARKRRRIVFAGINQAVRREQAEVHRENLNRDCREEVGRERNANHGEHRDEVVAHGILMRSAGNAERNSDKELQNGGDERDCKGNPHVFADNLGNRQIVFERVSEITAQKVANPGKVT